MNDRRPGPGGGLMPRKMLWGLLMVAVLIAIVALLNNSKHLMPKLAPTEQAVVDKSKVDARAPQSKPDSTTTPDSAEASPKSDREFQQWVRQEAQTMENPNGVGADKDAQIRKVISKITPVQAKHLQRILATPHSLPREKILSAYLLVEGGLKTREALKESIAAPLHEKGGESHSEDELKGIREKSLRIMMIDGLFAQAKTDANARTTLVRAIADSEDPYIKAYGQQRLKQLEPSSRQ